MDQKLLKTYFTIKTKLSFISNSKFVIVLLIILYKSAYTQNVNLEYFPGQLQPILQDAPTSSAMKVMVKDSIESNTYTDTVSGFYTYRIRGYLVPPQDGYYKFFLQSVNGIFNLSLDSMEYHKRLAISTNSWPYSLPWPINLSGRYNPSTTYYIDSIYLKNGIPYYFEIIQSEAQWLIYNSFGLKWVLPGGDQLQSIKNNDLRPAYPKPVRSEVDLDIFENQHDYDFTALKTKPFPSQRVHLHSLYADNIPAGLDNFSSRTRGYIIPPYDGTYSFYFASDDAGQFWLSTDTSETNAQLKSNIVSAQTDWTQNVSSQALLANQKYFFEILHHDSTGNHMFKLGWAISGDTVPEIIEYSNLMGYIDSIVPSGVRLNEHKKYMQRNQSFNLLYEVYPWNTINKYVRWKSTNPSVATISNSGTVTTHNLGECRIVVQCDADTTISDTLYLNVSRINWELFKDRITVDFDSLRNSSEPPDQIVEIVELNTPNYQSALDNYSSRIRGYLLPPVSGNYSFYFACDDAGQFWLSPDSIPSNAQLKSEINSIDNDWSQHVSVQSLTAGHKYYFELLHHDSVYKDKVKLGWIIPSDTVPVIISVPYMTGSEENIPVNAFILSDRKLLAYPNWTFSPRYQFTPWNATSQRILWESSNNAIASVSSNGEVTTIGPGVCYIFARVDQDAILVDTLQMTVTNYPGPYFVKASAEFDGEGHSWDNAIGLTKLLNLLSQGNLPQQISVYVAEGIFKPTNTIDRNKSFIMNNIRIVGGFPVGSTGTDTTQRDIVFHETILSGEIGAPNQTIDNSYHVVITRGPAIVDGFTIRDGRANCAIYGEENYYDLGENSGGGVILQSAQADIYNCKITNNSAINGGAGVYCGSQTPNPGGVLWGKNLIIGNCQISGNLIQQTIDTGMMFSVVANGYGTAVTVINGTCNLRNCVLKNNFTPWGVGKAIYLAETNANIENCSIFDNQGYYEDIWINGYSTLNMINSTLVGRFVTAANSSSNIINSTIIGGGYTAFDGNHLLFDNSIWSAPNLKFYDGTTSNSWQAKYSILGDTLFGDDKNSPVSISVPNCNTWLDTLAFNGGITPTMKLKSVPNNPAKSNGNSLYLGTTDQRGAVRADSVSIGAYQWVRPTDISMTPHQITLCRLDSVELTVAVLPAGMVSDSSYTITSLNNTIAHAAGSKIYALSPGTAEIIVQANDGGLADTCHVTVESLAGTGTISGNTAVCQGQDTAFYSVSGITNATSYDWYYSGTGATITNGSTNTITVSFASDATSGNLSVSGVNSCGTGPVSGNFPITVNPCVYTVHGTALYNNSAGTALDSIWVYLHSNTNVVDSVMTNLSGQYSIPSIYNGTYTLFLKSTKPWSGVNATDALKIQRHFAGLELLTEPVRIQAADVNNSNSINGTDAIKVKRRFAGLDTTFARGDWTFARPVLGGDTILVNGANVAQDFYGLCVGDVNGSNMPETGDNLLTHKVTITHSDVLEVQTGQEFSLPLRMSAPGKISAISLVIPYPSDLLKVESIYVPNGSPVYTKANGMIRIAWADIQALNLGAEDTLIVLKLKATDKFNAGQSIVLEATEESELADETGSVIPSAELFTKTIEAFNLTGTGYENSILQQFHIFPNPASNILNIELMLSEKAGLDVELADMLGKVQIRKSFGTQSSGLHSLRLNTAELINGVYMLKLRLDNGKSKNNFMYKVVISR